MLCFIINLQSSPNGIEFEHTRGRFDNYHPMESKSSHDMN